MFEEFNRNRRSFLRNGAIAIGASWLGLVSLLETQSGNIYGAEMTKRKDMNETIFGPIKQIDAGLLNVGYVEVGPSNGVPVILLHGFPYDIYSYAEVAPLLAAKGYRVVVPYLRGYGTTQF